MLVSIVVTNGPEQMSPETLHELIAKLGNGTKVGDREIVSLSLIKSNEVSGGYKEQDEMEVLSGKDSYEERLCGLKFNVSPFSFFQVNTLVFEKMIAQISEFAGIDNYTTLFDICCGTGAIGLCLSANAKKVIGVDIIEQAILNARQNVEMNQDKLQADKIEFHAGRAEEVMPPIVTRESGQGKIVGIVDPPRSGLHRDVLKALRTCKGLDRLIYVSCNAQSQMRDL
jgi:tRNA (uracil-5-)-methyltransferase